MTPKTLQLFIAATLLLVAPCCGYIVFASMQERNRVMAIPPQKLPGNVLVYSAPG